MYNTELPPHIKLQIMGTIARTVVCQNENLAHSLWQYLDQSARNNGRDESKIVRGPIHHNETMLERDVVIAEGSYFEVRLALACRVISVCVRQGEESNFDWSGIVTDIYGTHDADAGAGSSSRVVDHIYVDNKVIEQYDHFILEDADRGAGVGGNESVLPDRFLPRHL